MRGFYRYLAPFAPDYSGAVSVLFGMGGLCVLCDPGGCSGNVCGYDEPRFYGGGGLLFSAALRDMDTIMGRDDRLLGKLESAVAGRSHPFAALIGTPVTSVIGTDLRGVAKTASRRLGFPVIAVGTDGTRTYGYGQRLAWKALSGQFCRDGAAGSSCTAPARDASSFSLPPVEGRGMRTLVIGATPLDLPSSLGWESYKRGLRAMRPGSDLRFMGDAGTWDVEEEFLRASSVLVTAAPALDLARRMCARHGIPLEVSCGFDEAFAPVEAALARVLPPSSSDAAEYPDEAGKAGRRRVLVIHTQLAANGLRRRLGSSRPDLDVVAGSFFGLDPELAEPGDLAFGDEEAFIGVVEQGGFCAVVGDPMYRRALEGRAVAFVSLTHFAVSGSLFEEAAQ